MGHPEKLQRLRFGHPIVMVGAVGSSKALLGTAWDLLEEARHDTPSHTLMMVGRSVRSPACGRLRNLLLPPTRPRHAHEVPAHDGGYVRVLVAVAQQARGDIRQALGRDEPHR